MNALSPITKRPTIEQRLQSLADAARAIPDLDGIDTVLLDQAADLIERVLVGYENRDEPMDSQTVFAVQARIGKAA